MINKYQFLNTKNPVKTIASVFISGDIGLSLSGGNNIIDIYSSYAEYDMSGDIFSFYPYYGADYEKRISDNNFSIIKQNNLVTGYTIVQDLLRLYSDVEKKDYATTTLDDIISNSPLGTKTGVQLEDVENNDFFINIPLESNYGLLETLTIKNNVLGEWNQVEAATGIVFGTLIATQKLKDDNDEFIKIPLRNVPILIFNQTEEITTTIQSSDDNSRISVNMIENSDKKLYANEFSYLFDKEILPSTDTKNVTDKYKYSTTTNERGEFILKDVPTGLRTMILEIDLLKQGLTPEEVELNISPYPKSNDLTPEQVPHLIYREVPIEVLPAWGTLNTGYTRVDINMNIDLRKWTTYFVPPITAYKKTYDEILQAGFQAVLSLNVRNMASKGTQGQLFPNDNIECVVVPDILQRNKDRLLSWYGEQRQLRSSINFNQMSFNVFKLPANIYDANAYKTDGSGNTTNDKGVWLSSYEFKMFFNDENKFYRVSGLNMAASSKKSNKIDVGSSSIGKIDVQEPNSGKPALGIGSNNLYHNHYDLNYESQNPVSGVSVGVFPYEKPWTKDYPVKYSIPKIPIKINEGKDFYNENGYPTNMLVPKYLDGDRIGLQMTVDNVDFGGWGAQTNGANDVYPNYFAQQVTTSDLYRYESAISINDEFSNGYTPNLSFGNVPENQKSNVENGEIYQRVECGHAYFMWVQGFPRVVNMLKFDKMFPNDFLNPDPILLPVPHYPSYLNDSALFNNDTLLTTDFIQIKEFQKGYLYLYKIVDPDPKLLAPPQVPLVKRYVKLNFQQTFFQRGGLNEKARAAIEDGGADNRFKFRHWFDVPDNTKETAILRIKNNGIISSEINIGNEPTRIAFGESADFLLDDFINGGGVLELPTNDEFDFSINTYYMTNYEMSIHNLNFYAPNGDLKKTINDLSPTFGNIKLSGNTKLDEEVPVPEYFLVSKIENIRVRGPVGKPKPNSILIDCSSTSDINGLVLMSCNGSNTLSYEFRDKQIETDGGKSDNLPYHVLSS